MRNPMIGIAAALLLLTACETVPEDMADAAMDGAAGEALAAVVPPVVEVPAAPIAPVAEEEVAAPPAPETKEYFMVEVGDRVFFDYDEFNLSEFARATLDRQAEWLRTYPSVTITIEGHADERGTRDYNLALGDRRANSVSNYLHALGIDRERMSTVSWGKEKPAALGSNETAWALNRRAVTTITEGTPVN